MDWQAHNAGFVLAAYLISALCLVGLAGFIFLQDRARAKALQKRDS